MRISKAVPGSTNWSIGSNMYLANVTLHPLDSSSILSCGNDSFYESGPNPQGANQFHHFILVIIL